MNESDFANLYLERIMNEVTELTKIRMMNETRISFLEKINAEQAKQLESLMQSIEKSTVRKEKLNKSHKEVEMGTF